MSFVSFRSLPYPCYRNANIFPTKPISPLLASGKRIPGPVQMGMLRHPKAEGLPSSISSYSYRRVKVEPLGSDPKRASPQDRRPWGYLRRAGVVVAVALVVFLAIWNHLFGVNVGSVTLESGTALPPHSTFTVRMNSFRRNDLLKKSVEHFSSCDCVGQIQVVWSDQKNAPPALSMFTEGARRKVLFEVHDTDSLNHRFNITVPIATDGVFSVDDDLRISCEDLRFGFDTWRSSQSTMVGFTPRLVTHDPETSLHSYRSWRVARWNGVYNVVLTKCCFLHRDHLRTYIEKMPRSLLAYIDRHRNCEDLAMSLVVAKYYNSPPLWVSGGVQEIGGDGISSSASHFIARGKCIDVFAREFGGMPLLDTSARVYPMRSRLLSWL